MLKSFKWSGSPVEGLCYENLQLNDLIFAAWKDDFLLMSLGFVKVKSEAEVVKMAMISLTLPTVDNLRVS